MRELYELQGAGRYEDAIQLVLAWHRALKRAAPDDELALLEVILIAGWAVHLSGDEHAAEQNLLWSLSTASDLVERYQAAAEQRPSDEAATRLERAKRAVGIAANYLGVLYLEVNDQVDRARSYLEWALRMHGNSRREALLRAQTLGNLGIAERVAGDLVSARDRFREAVKAVEAIPELPQLVEYPEILANLAEVEDILGEEDASERDLRAALSLAQARVTGDSVSVADIQVRLATRLMRWGSWGEAEIHLRQALGIYQRSLPAGHHREAEAMYALAYVLWTRGLVDDAIDISDHALGVGDIDLRHRLEMGAEDVRVSAAVRRRLPLDFHLSLGWAHPDHPVLAHSAFDAVLRRKALTTEITATERAAQLAYERDGIREDLHELKALREQLSEALLSGATEESVGELVREIRFREETIGRFQRREVVPSGDVGELQEDPEWAERLRRFKQWMRPSRELPDVLPGDTVLVEYVRFLRLEPGRWEQRDSVFHYLALVWRGEAAAPQIVRLGKADPLDRLVADLGAALEEDGTILEAGGQVPFARSRTAELAERLRAVVLDPVLTTAGEVRRLLLAPDGELGKVAFHMLPTAEGNVIDRYEVAYLTSGRDLLRPAAAAQPLEAPLVMADPDYDAGGGARLVITEGFDRLAETRREGVEIAEMLGADVVLNGAATEQRLKAVRSPQILHVATHGWFLPAADGAEQPEWVQHPRLARLLEAAIHTWGVRSGLVLAGFNVAWSGGDLPEELGDGLLTAGEAAALELTGTELVVLSACETGLGRMVDLEGAYGLRRAFLIAGARAVVTALWKVPDEPSRMLMLEFYRRLLKGAARTTALRDAQLLVRARLAHPYLWGGFVMHGDPGPLHPEVLATLRRTSPENDAGRDAEREAQRLLGTEALRRGDLEEAAALLHEPAEAGDAVSAALMAIVDNERGDDDRAERWCERAAQADQPMVAFLLGQFQAKRGDLEEAERWWRVAVQGGVDDASQALAALLRRRGEREEARRLWQAAAERGHRDSLYAVGNEADLDGDDEEAAKWWIRAADAGDSRGALQLADLCQRRGDRAGFERWWRRAAELGEPDAAKPLAMAALEEGRVEEAIALWRTAAERGDMESAHNLGVALHQRDDPRAEAWWWRAANAGFPQSARNLGSLLEQRGDLDGAAHYWRLAAENGHERAPVQLGRLLLDRGRVEEAEGWLRPAAEHGDPEGAEALARLLEGRGQAAEADRWRRAAAAAGQPQAMHFLATAAAEQGDMEAAASLWLRAAQGGDPASAARLGELLDAAGRSEEAEGWWSWAADAGDGDAAVALAAHRWRRGDLDGVRQAVSAAAAGGAERARTVLRLLDADKDLLHRRAARGHVGAMLQLLQLAQLRKDEDEERRWLAAAADAGDLDALMAAGGMALEMGDDGGAERWLHTAAERGQPDAAHRLADLYTRRGERGRAMEWAQRAERLTEAWAANEAGLAAYKAGVQEEAERQWRAAAQAGSVDAAANLASALLRRDATAESERWARVAVDGGVAECANLLGQRCIVRGEHAEARAWFNRAMELVRGR